MEQEQIETIESVEVTEETSPVEESVYTTPPLTRASRQKWGGVLLPGGDFQRRRRRAMERAEGRRGSAPEPGEAEHYDLSNIHLAPGNLDLATLGRQQLERPPTEVPTLGPTGVKRDRRSISRLDQTIANTPKRPNLEEPKERFVSLAQEIGERSGTEEEEEEDNLTEAGEIARDTARTTSAEEWAEIGRRIRQGGSRGSSRSTSPLPPTGFVRNMVNVVEGEIIQRPNSPNIIVQAPTPSTGNTVVRPADQPLDRATLDRYESEFANALAQVRAQAAAAGNVTGTSASTTRPSTRQSQRRRQQNTNTNTRFPFGGEPMSNPSGEQSDESVVDLDRQPGLYQNLKHLAKPVKLLSAPARRDTAETRTRIAQHLNQITPANVKQALDYEFQGIASNIQTNVTDTIREKVTELDTEMRRELQEIRREKELLRYERQIARREMEAAKHLMVRVERLEENEKLSSRVSTEKKDGIFPNLTYPSIDADEDLVRKSVIALAAAVKVIERQHTYERDPYNFILFVALEANKVAAIHRLSANQQRELVLNALPIDHRRNYYSLAATLEELYQVISVLAPSILTISDLERSINKWQLENKNAETLMNSVTQLIDLLIRSAQHRDRDQAVRYPEIFRQAIGRIQRDESLPHDIHQALAAARIKVRDEDTVPQLNNYLFGALNPYIGRQPRNKQKSSSTGAIPKVSKVEKDKKVKAIEQVTSKDGNQKSSTDTKPQETGTKPKGNWKNRRYDRKEKKFSFVKPWPEGKNYLSKNGNSLTKECEEHFKGFCFRCGHNSHTPEDCRIYKSKDVYITLCTRCRQGFHDSCKSKRYNIKEDTLNKKIEMIERMCEQLTIAQQAAYGNAQAQSGKGKAAIRHDDDDSD